MGYPQGCQQRESGFDRRTINSSRTARARESSLSAGLWRELYLIQRDNSEPVEKWRRNLLLVLEFRVQRFLESAGTTHPCASGLPHSMFRKLANTKNMDKIAENACLNSYESPANEISNSCWIVVQTTIPRELYR